MQTKDFSYDLPKHLIAQTPLVNRTASKLMVVDKSTGAIKHAAFNQLHHYLVPNDVIVINDTQVIPARLIGIKKETHATIEVLLLKSLDDDVWECLVRKAKKISLGTKIVFGNGILQAECVGVKAEGIRDFKFTYNGIFYELLDQLGDMPLPPYITEKLTEKNRYQTVYSKHKGSAAAPTAGLHFTKAYLNQLKAMGIQIVPITLHVGLGTFRPVSVTDVTAHKMHEEYYSISDVSAKIIDDAKRNQQRIIAVGTTSLRTLETVALKHGKIIGETGYSELFIYPGFSFKVVDALITNFHLPESTLLMLVSAFSSQAIIKQAYTQAINNSYRFFSFGDAMFLTKL